MKAIMMSIRPRHSCNILNLIKLWEIRKKFPSDYVGWVYIYVTKDKNLLRKVVEYDESSMTWYQPHYEIINDKNCDFDILNGKVVARFWCDKVEEHRPFFHWCIEKETCLTRDDVLDYLDSKDKFVGNPKRQGKVYAIHITKLKTFDKPKELKNFLIYSHTISGIGFKGEEKTFKVLKPLTKAPQSWQYIEVDEC